MVLNNYTIKNRPIKEILDNVDMFTRNMEKFKSKHSGYSYTIELRKYEDLWDADITIRYEKQEDIKERTSVVEPPALL